MLIKHKFIAMMLRRVRISNNINNTEDLIPVSSMHSIIGFWWYDVFNLLGQYYEQNRLIC